MAIGRSTDSVEYSVPSIVFSVCTASEISIWTYTVSYLLTHVPSLHYLVVVPDLDVSLFRSITPKTVTVMPESVVVGDLRTRLEEKLAKQSQARVGWYLQQFIKLSILYETKIEDKIVIWDADTVPLRELALVFETGR